MEFENNLKEVDRVLQLNAKNLKNAVELSAFTGPNLPNITDKTFGKYFFGVTNNEVQYRPGSGVVNEILNSGKLNIFQNKKLKNALASLDGLLLKIRFQENKELSTSRYELLLLAKDNVSIRKMVFDSYGKAFGLDRGKFLDSNLKLLTSKKFDNRLAGFIYTSGFLEGRYKELKKQIQEIIDIINSQIKYK
jgi:ribosomal protein S17E